ncbi:MAG: hypothetical protein RIS94_649 [Pseudomonadota bacterium]|jgi:hypothetical protein
MAASFTIMSAHHPPLPMPYPAGRRQASRLRLGIPAKVILLGGTFDCRLDDLSQSGARIAIAAAMPTPGSDAVLTVNGIEAFGMVRWARMQRFGVEFDAPLPLEQVVAIRHFADNYAAHAQEQQLRVAREYVQGRQVL